MPDNKTTNNLSNLNQNPSLQNHLCALNPLVEKAQLIANHPYTQAEVKRANIAEYNKKIKDYNKLALNLSNKEIEDLVFSIHSGENTFEDLKKVVPRINSSTICSYLIDKPKSQLEGKNLILNMDYMVSLNTKRPYYFKLAKTPSDFYAPYEFKPTDSFALTITAQNLIYQLEKERYMKELAEKSLAIAEASLKQSEKSTKYGKYAAILAFVGIIVTIYLSKF